MEAKVIDGCISCGACIATCPEVFRFDEDGLAEAYAKVTPEHESAAIASTWPSIVAAGVPSRGL